MTAPAADNRKITYIPYMSDHAHVFAAVMRSMNMCAEVLPPSGDESITIGLDLCNGRECLPCFMTTGDFILRSRQPGFEPSRAVFLMPHSTGPCRFGQYSTLQRDILASMGLGDVSVVSPSISNSYDGLGSNPEELRKRFWEGALAVDLLTKVLHEHRPYELDSGAADVAYQAALADVVDVMELHGGGKPLLAALDRGAALFERIPVERSVARPVIAMIGEVYVRLNPKANRSLVQQVEAAGGQVSLTGFCEWQYGSHWNQIQAYRLHRRRGKQLKAELTQIWMRHREHQMHARVAGVLREGCEPKVADAAARLRPYFDPALEGEIVGTLERAIETARRGVSGILNVLPFSCMPGVLSSAMGPRLRRDHDWIPWLDLSFDGQETTNTRTRLEAFMHQAHQFHRRRVAE